MENFSKRLYEEMQKEFNYIRFAETNNLEVPRKSYQCAEKFLYRLEQFMTGYKFKSVDEQHRYYTGIRPRFQEHAMYWYEMIYIELYTPIGDQKAVRAFLKQQVCRFQMYFERNNLFYTFYRMGKLEKDSLPDNYGELFYLENRNGTMTSELNHRLSHKLAKMKAYESLINFICAELYGPESPTGSTEEDFPKLVWTDTKASLIELIYSIHSKGSVNFGHVDVKPLANGFERLLNVDLGNYYRVYYGFPLRAQPTAYLDSLRTSLRERMDRDRA